MACLAEHLGHYVSLTSAERAALEGLTTGARHYRRGAVVRPEHGPTGEIVVVEKGWLFSSAMLEDGRRQIVGLHFHGDLLGLDSLAFDTAPDAICALTDAAVCAIDRAKLGELFVRHPRLGAVLFAAQQVDRVALTDRLVSLGRNPARGRVAALLLWMAGRLRLAGVPVDDGFVLPLTQEEIGDLTGLTAVHVNRTFRVLGEQGLIARSGTSLQILDPHRLARAANYIPRREAIDQNWLPAAE